LEFGIWNLGLGSLKAKSLFYPLGIWYLEFGTWILTLSPKCELYNELKKLCNTIGYGCFHLCRVIYREKGLNAKRLPEDLIQV